MKKILLISFEYPVSRTYCGGVGQIVKQCRNALLKLGYEPYVLITASFQKKYPVKLLLPDDTLVNYKHFWNFQKDYGLCRFNYIIQHFINWTGELRKIKNRKGRKPKIIYHFHSILRREKDSGFKTLNHFLHNQEKMIYIADKIICPSRYEYDNFSRYFPSFLNKVVLIENTIETFSKKPKQIKEIRAEYNIRKNDTVALYVGRLENIKGADVIIKYLPGILKRHAKLKFFMIGKTLQNDLYKKLMRLKNQFPQQLFYIRHMDKDKLFQFHYLSHIYIHSSLSESFSLSTHESALCNNALLLNRLPVLDKFKDAAMFFDVGADNFIPGFEHLIKNRRLRSRLSRRAFRIAKGFLAKNRLKEKLSELLRL
ncbi:MAG: hypothetical protein COV72_01505 [Candidatus Omnitrophica bacterium CG11_big_fil_rev_8_21_14_0_20_42_13]|uniref:Glycosyl transferase family 1 domain-containing protein n=1 Tax=Candidatus Ghiorseimicrobium undicola TaxID=1974746 RepID=A0A2H0LZF4_9BACT|nr:MAG: hypothetical protein COV72_01505 [Candidatus Omnitrophica bacterium CG11_big_fil_rev_8_21_14_0_20_42_13]